MMHTRHRHPDILLAMDRSNRRSHVQPAVLAQSSATRLCRASTQVKHQILSVILNRIQRDTKISTPFLLSRKSMPRRRLPHRRLPHPTHIDTNRVAVLVCRIMDQSLGQRVFVGSRGRRVRAPDLHRKHFPIRTVTLVDRLTIYLQVLRLHKVATAEDTAKVNDFNA
jgi:hypothetical protein